MFLRYTIKYKSVTFKIQLCRCYVRLHFTRTTFKWNSTVNSTQNKTQHFQLFQLVAAIDRTYNSLKLCHVTKLFFHISRLWLSWPSDDCFGQTTQEIDHVLYNDTYDGPVKYQSVLRCHAVCFDYLGTTKWQQDQQLQRPCSLISRRWYLSAEFFAVSVLQRITDGLDQLLVRLSSNHCLGWISSV